MATRFKCKQTRFKCQQIKLKCKQARHFERFQCKQKGLKKKRNNVQNNKKVLIENNTASRHQGRV